MIQSYTIWGFTVAWSVDVDMRKKLNCRVRKGSAVDNQTGVVIGPGTTGRTIALSNIQVFFYSIHFVLIIALFHFILLS